MDFSKLSGKIFFKNKFIDSKKANVHVLNHSLHFASAIFEGIRVYNSKSLFLRDHIHRLFQSAEIMRLRINYSSKQVEKIIQTLIVKNKLNEGYIRPIVFRSSHSMSPETSKCKSILAIAGWKWGNLFTKDNGISINLSKYPRLNYQIYPIHAKSSGSYQTSVISRIDSKKKKF